MTIGERLYQLRGDLSQSQLARAADVPDSHYNRIEGGFVMPTLRTCTKLAKALDMTVATLLTGVTIEEAK
jgi:transcriptional regulator with XRE-family HTH domain